MNEVEVCAFEESLLTKLQNKVGSKLLLLLPASYFMQAWQRFFLTQSAKALFIMYVIWQPFLEALRL